MTNFNFEVVTVQQQPDLWAAMQATTEAMWPEFMLHDAYANRYWDGLPEDFPAFQFALLDVQKGQIAAAGNSLALHWDGASLPDTGWDWAIEKGFQDRAAGKPSNVQCALSITLAADYQGKGVSARVVEAMKALGAAQGLQTLIAPVRPNQKSRYPLTPMERYIQWQNEDGQPFDAWLRVHSRLGARLIKICPQSMRIMGSVEQWENWTQMRFPESGAYVIPGGLVPVEIDREGTYIEPNVWMQHRRD